MSDRAQETIMRDWVALDCPVASVCCLTYNHKKYIRKAIDSFLMQDTNFPFEIVVHDDASTDGTRDIVLEYAKRYPRIIKLVLQTENQYRKGGLIGVRLVFPKTKGRYVALCEGDDYWTDSRKLQKQVDFLDAHSEYVITYTDSQPFDEHGYVDVNFGGAVRDVSAMELVRGIPLYTLTTCFRNVIKELPFDLLSARLGDQVIWSLLGAHGKGKYLSDISPAAYRVHDGGVHLKKSQLEKIEMSLLTSNALLSYYSRLKDEPNARYFAEYSFRLSRRLIGWKRLSVLLLQGLFVGFSR
jgi:glycosyltransferase involved in cell wall biosynthesis